MSLSFKDYIKLVENKNTKRCEKCECEIHNNYKGGECPACGCKLVQEAEFDYGHKDPTKLNKFGKNYTAYSQQGRADLKQNTNNPRQGDNSLKEDEKPDHMVFGGGLTFGSLKIGDKFKFKGDDNIVFIKVTKTKYKKYNTNERSYITGPKTAVKLVETLKENRMNEYKPKNVKGLYSYAHFAHPDGSFYQIRHGEPFTAVHQDAEGNRKKFDNEEDLKTHINGESLHEDKQTDLDRLQNILMNADVSVEEIKSGGVKLSQEGKEKIAAQMGLAAKDIDTLLLSLQAHLNRDNKLIQEFDDDEEEMNRYSFEDDMLGNITVRDRHTGDSKYLQGSEANDLASELEHETDPKAIQSALKKVFLTENNLFEFAFSDEINADSGTYNMPWKFNRDSGTMTVFFSLEGGKPKLKIDSLRDKNGDEMDIADLGINAENELLSQAEDFIGKE